MRPLGFGGGLISDSPACAGTCSLLDNGSSRQARQNPQFLHHFLPQKDHPAFPRVSLLKLRAFHLYR
jgi:hypothetical protein